MIRIEKLILIIAAFMNLPFLSVKAEVSPPIIVVGDLHGDYKAYQKIMEMANLIDGKGQWIGGDTIFVQVGDIVDRGPDSRKIINHIKILQQDAPKVGGQVITLIGNHEAMIRTNDLRYVHPGEYAAFKSRQSKSLRRKIFKTNEDAIVEAYGQAYPGIDRKQIRKMWEEATPLGKLEYLAAWRNDGEIGQWLLNNPAVAMIGDTLLVHAGLSAAYSHLGIDKLNQAVAAALLQNETSPDSILHDPQGPLWHRAYIIPPKTEGQTREMHALQSEAELTSVLQAYGAKRMVVGHTPSLTGIRSLFGGKLIQVDTGASAHYGGTYSFLEIENDRLVAHDNGVARVLEGQIE